MSLDGSFWEPQIPGDEEDSYSTPVPEARVREWEQRRSLRLPLSLAEALQVHNGGRVRDTMIWIDSLDEFSILDAKQWDQHFSPGNQEEEFEGVDRSKLVLIGDACGCGVVLDYRGGSEPRVLVMHHNLGGVLRDEDCSTFDEFVRVMRQ